MSLMSLREGVSPLNKGSNPAIFHSFLNAAVHLFPFLLRGPVENIKDRVEVTFNVKYPLPQTVRRLTQVISSNTEKA